MEVWRYVWGGELECKEEESMEVCGGRGAGV